MTDYTRALPLELLRAILDHGSHADVMFAGRVSRDWRAVAQLCDEYYYVLLLDPTLEAGWEGCGTTNVSTWISWVDVSAPVPLHLFVSIPAKGHMRHPTLEAGIKLAETIARAGPRTRQIGFLIDDHDIFGRILETMTHIAAPLLKTFLLTTDDERPSLSLPAQLLTGGAPRLQTVDLTWMVLPASHLCGLATVKELQLTLPAGCRGSIVRFISQSSRATHEALRVFSMSEHTVDAALQVVDFSRHRLLQIDGQLDSRTFIRGLPEDTDLRLAMVFDKTIPIREVGSRRSSIVSVLSAWNVPQQVQWQHPGTGLTIATYSIDIFVSVMHRLTLLDVFHWYLPYFLLLVSELPSLSTLRSHVCHRSMQNAFWPVVMHGWPVECPKVQCPALRMLVLYHIRPICQVESTIRREGLILLKQWHIPASHLHKLVDTLSLLDRGVDEKPVLELADLDVWLDIAGVDWAAAFKDIVYKKPVQ